MVLGTLRRDQGGPERFALSLAQAHAAGVKVDWEAFFKGTGRKARRPAHLPLPAQALLAQRRRPAQPMRRRSARATPITRCWAR